MRKLLNTLYITTPKSYLSLDGENLVVLLEEQEKFRIPFVNIEAIVCFGYMGASPALMGKCADDGVALSFLQPNGEFLAKIVGKTKGNIQLRLAQFYAYENEEQCLDFAKKIISAKLANTRFVLERAIRDNQDNWDVSGLEEVSTYLKGSIPRLQECGDILSLMGVEGVCAKQYFGVFGQMIVQQRRQFVITERNKRPPLDPVNCMLSYLYTILGLEIQSALETVGLDPALGFMHSTRSGRASLAQDLIEELRAILVDRTVLTLINLKQISEKDFVQKEGGAVLMTEDGRKKILSAWQEKKKEIITHPIIGEKIEIGLLPFVQAQLLSRYLRGDLDTYHPFLAK